ncbi:MAG: ABC transporter permease [Eubacteriales bacterium]|nr:ABC transporter permease [Eubacteriales bacterium]
MLGAAEGAVIQGVLWGIMAIGVFITFRLLDFPDLTVDGSFALGGAVCARLIVEGMAPILAMIVAGLTGLLAGYITAFLNTKFKIPAILAGILAQISLYSVNLRVMARPNTPLLKNDTLFDNVRKGLKNAFGWEIGPNYISLIIGLICVILVVLLLYWFFGTEIGCAIRATGHNPDMVRAQGQNTNTTVVLALMLSNSLVAFSGALVAMHQGYADVQMGVGAIVIGLASIVIGEVILSRTKSFASALAAIVVGSVLYRIIIALVLQLGLKTDDLKMFTAIIVSLALGVPVLKRHLNVKKAVK